MPARVTVVIPCKTGRSPRYAPPQHPEVEVLVVTGSNVSRQRNEAAARASAELVYFLDDDVQLPEESLWRAVDLMQVHSHLAGLGGPSLTHPQAAPWEHLVGVLLSQWWVALGTRARNCPVGQPRASDGTELITCNLLIRKVWLERVGGFDPSLHPGEDIEFLRRVHGQGGPLLYHPGVVVWRHRRRNWQGLAWQYFRYGLARGLMVRRQGWQGQWPYLLPLLLPCLGWGGWAWLWPYALLCGWVALRVGRQLGSLAWGLVAFFLVPLVHGSYAAGIVAGALGGTPPQTRRPE